METGDFIIRNVCCYDALLLYESSYYSALGWALGEIVGGGEGVFAGGERDGSLDEGCAVVTVEDHVEEL